jgi:hypothetical protein
MSDIVEKRRKTDRKFLAVFDLGYSLCLMIAVPSGDLPGESTHRFFNGTYDADDMLQPSMASAWKHQLGQPQLPNASHPLK